MHVGEATMNRLSMINDSGLRCRSFYIVKKEK